MPVSVWASGPSERCGGGRKLPRHPLTAYRVGRRGAGFPLLLIPGIGAHLEMWAPFVGLAGDRELIAFDPPGPGSPNDLVSR